MSKYDALRDFLRAQERDEVTLRFSDAPLVMGFELPESALRYQAFWANQTDTDNRPQAKAWLEAGFVVESHRLSKKNGWVRFRRR